MAYSLAPFRKRTREMVTSEYSSKDDVFHLAAAKSLGALLTHDPGESIYNV
jgi:hypothetical protein